MGQWARLYRMFIIFRPNSIISATEMVFSLKFSFQCSFFFLHQNLVSSKLVQLFDWKYVNGKDSTGDLSFFCQIPSFRPSKWHFFKIFVSVLFFLRWNLELHKFMKLFDSKWVSGQDSIGCSSFFG